MSPVHLNHNSLGKTDAVCVVVPNRFSGDSPGLLFLEGADGHQVNHRKKKKKLISEN